MTEPKSIFRPARQVSQSRDLRAEKLAKFNQDMSGDGQFIYENNTRGDILLPRPTKYGRKQVKVGEQFLGDSYYMQMVKTHELKFIKEITPIGGVDVPITKQELIKEVPPTYNESGIVKEKPLTEEEKNKEGDVLLTEKPVDGIQIF